MSRGRAWGSSSSARRPRGGDRSAVKASAHRAAICAGVCVSRRARTTRSDATSRPRRKMLARAGAGRSEGSAAARARRPRAHRRLRSGAGVGRVARGARAAALPQVARRRRRQPERRGQRGQRARLHGAGELGTAAWRRIPTCRSGGAATCSSPTAIPARSTGGRSSCRASSPTRSPSAPPTASGLARIGPRPSRDGLVPTPTARTLAPRASVHVNGLSTRACRSPTSSRPSTRASIRAPRPSTPARTYTAALGMRPSATRVLRVRQPALARRRPRPAGRDGRLQARRLHGPRRRRPALRLRAARRCGSRRRRPRRLPPRPARDRGPPRPHVRSRYGLHHASREPRRPGALHGTPGLSGDHPGGRVRAPGIRALVFRDSDFSRPRRASTRNSLDEIDVDRPQALTRSCAPARRARRGTRRGLSRLPEGPRFGGRGRIGRGAALRGVPQALHATARRDRLEARRGTHGSRGLPQWIRPTSVDTLQTVAVAGLPVEDQFVLPGGDLRQCGARWEWTGSASWFATAAWQASARATSSRRSTACSTRAPIPRLVGLWAIGRKAFRVGVTI